MRKISVVIITKNEALNIVDCIISARKVSDDIIIIDSGSTDATVELAKLENVTVHSIIWKGYGYARNMGSTLAANDWILSLDADERITTGLAQQVAFASLDDSAVIYGFKRQNFFADTRIKFGALAHDRVFRLYNRNNSQWNLVPVHEQLVGKNIKRCTLSSYATHYGIRTASHYWHKKMRYAFLCAVKYKQSNRQLVLPLRVLAPVFNFLKAYIFQLGFLDKEFGFIIAKINAEYTRRKYEHLQVLKEDDQPKMPAVGMLQKPSRQTAISFEEK